MSDECEKCVASEQERAKAVAEERAICTKIVAGSPNKWVALARLKKRSDGT